MVICSACKQYTDDQEETCQHCGAPLVPDRLERVRETLELHPDVAVLAGDRQRAQLVASGVIARYPSGFFFDDGQRRTVLVELFGAPATPQRTAAALLFAAIAYLAQEGYCRLEPTPDGKGFYWNEGRRWDGQIRSLEGAFARRAGLGMRIRDVVDQVVADEMDFRFEVNRPPLLRAPGVPRPPRVINLSARPATTAVIGTGRMVELPDHRENEACRETYRRLLAFVQADPGRARYLAEQIVEVLDWFRRFEEDPTLALMRQVPAAETRRTRRAR